MEVADIMDQQMFQRMLCLERKRSERSSRPFVLMLLDSGGLLRNGNDTSNVLQRILGVVSHSTRETDIKGWQKDGKVIGVIFTEIGVTDGRAVTKTLLSRITRRLGDTLSGEDAGKITLSFYVFPEDSTKQGLEDWEDSPLYPDVTHEINERRVERFLKRSLDLAGSLCALILLSPVFLVIAAAVKLSSRGPVFFTQERVGQFGNTFTFLKFRSMQFANDHTIHQEYVKRLISGAADVKEEDEQKLYKLTKDPRVTQLGKFLRRNSLDELPQFLNVLTGDMSLVGPRPPIPYEFECYSTWQKRRLHSVKPGITGLWQVGGRNTITFDDMVRMDLEYARTWTLWLDIKILLKTPRAAVMGI